VEAACVGNAKPFHDLFGFGLIHPGQGRREIENSHVSDGGVGLTFFKDICQGCVAMPELLLYLGALLARPDSFRHSSSALPRS